MTTHKVFSPLQIGDLTLKHRVVLAPLTRRRSPSTVPNELNVEYYKQRSSQGGLLITEATFISPTAGAYPQVPGIWTEEQKQGWKQVTDAVHSKGAYVYCQLWHVGRATTVSALGQKPFSSTSKALKGINVNVPPPQEYSEAIPMTRADIDSAIRDYVHASQTAIAAGFDGVEIHGAHGYLLDQFMQDNINDRTDEFSVASLENRFRFTLMVVNAVTKAIGNKRTAIRISPWGEFHEARDSKPIEHFTYLCEKLPSLAYVHVTEPRDTLFATHDQRLSSLETRAAELGESLEEFTSLKPLKKALKSPLIVAGGELKASIKNVEDETIDAVAIGRYFISNPDLPYRLANNVTLTPYNRATFYTAGPEGYTDYATAVGPA